MCENLFCTKQSGESLKTNWTVFCWLFAFEIKLKSGTALKVLPRILCSVRCKFFMEGCRKLATLLNIIDGMGQYDCSNGDQLRIKN